MCVIVVALQSCFKVQRVSVSLLTEISAKGALDSTVGLEVVCESTGCQNGQFSLCAILWHT